MRMNQITENFRRDFFDDYGGESKCLEPDSYGNVEFVGPTEALFKARCWYTVAYGKSATEKNIKYRSFPWLIWDVMLPAKRKKVMATVFVLIFILETSTSSTNWKYSKKG